MSKPTLIERLRWAKRHGMTVYVYSNGLCVVNKYNKDEERYDIRVEAPTLYQALLQAKKELDK
jgi:hypothetical protein